MPKRWNRRGAESEGPGGSVLGIIIIIVIATILAFILWKALEKIVMRLAS